MLLITLSAKLAIFVPNNFFSYPGVTSYITGDYEHIYFMVMVYYEI